jgi:hypothetical protein
MPYLNPYIKTITWQLGGYKMNAGAFIIIGVVGKLILLIMGNRMLNNPEISSRRFAYSFALLFALLLFVLILVSRQISAKLFFLVFLLSTISFVVGYQVLNYFHVYRLKKKH